MVVTTARGDLITDLDIEDHQILGALCGWLALLPDAGIYLDGELVPDEVVVGPPYGRAHAEAVVAASLEDYRARFPGADALR